MEKSSRNAFVVIALVALVNALGYGIIIPILYSYSRSFGLSDFQNGLLFSVYSICQFFATPFIGRLSDAYGRKPLLFLSLVGTAISFFLMAGAQNAWWLFFARALDGITAGNIPVALAVISDTTTAKDRAKGFGIVGASFGFGFTFGPAISALTLHYGIWVPFLIAGAVSLLSAIVTVILLPETNQHKARVIQKHVFDFRHLVHALFDPTIGITLAISFLVMLAFSIYTYVFQPFSVEVMKLPVTTISLIFTAIGVIGLFSQGFIIPKTVKRFGERQMLVFSVFLSVVMYALLFVVRSYGLFLAVVAVQAFANGFPNPILQSLLSKETDEKSQGSILGVNASYQSIGQILGPIIGGIVSGLFTPLPFVFAGLSMAVAGILASRMLHKHLSQQSLA